MSLRIILALVLFSGVYWTIIPARFRPKTLLIASFVMLYALQPKLDIPGLTFALPTVLIVITLGVGALIQPPEKTEVARWLAVGVIALILLALAPNARMLAEMIHDIVRDGPRTRSSTMYTLGLLVIFCFTILAPVVNAPRKYRWPGIVLIVLLLAFRLVLPDPASPAELWSILSGKLFPIRQSVIMAVLIGATALPIFVPRAQTLAARKKIAWGWLGVMLVILIVFKSDILRETANAELRGGILPRRALDLQWIGMSYIFFRLAHVLFDLRDDSLVLRVSLPDFMTYVFFFPTIMAGPITRLDKVVPQFTENLSSFKVDYLVVGGMRLLAGVVKKFVVAATLSIIALQPSLFSGADHQMDHPLILWLMLYASLFLFYFDFSGYSDIAIGLGQMFGINLPENFDRPFRQPNISLFWQSWHMTLSVWFRQYWFNRVVRRLIKSPLRKRQNVIVFIAQLSTMCLIGLWHQISINWVLWGVWHGVGLFVYKMIADHTRQRFWQWTQDPLKARLARTANIVITFHYILLSFVLISLPDPQTAGRFWLALFGLRMG